MSGLGAWTLAARYFDGPILDQPIMLSIKALAVGDCELGFNTLRGFSYQVQSVAGLGGVFVNDPEGTFLATEMWNSRTETPIGNRGFYRVFRILAP